MLPQTYVRFIFLNVYFPLFLVNMADILEEKSNCLQVCACLRLQKLILCVLTLVFYAVLRSQDLLPWKQGAREVMATPPE